MSQLLKLDIYAQKYLEKVANAEMDQEANDLLVAMDNPFAKEAMRNPKDLPVPFVQRFTLIFICRLLKPLQDSWKLNVDDPNGIEVFETLIVPKPLIYSFLNLAVLFRIQFLIESYHLDYVEGLDLISLEQDFKENLKNKCLDKVHLIYFNSLLGKHWAEFCDDREAFFVKNPADQFRKDLLYFLGFLAFLLVDLYPAEKTRHNWEPYKSLSADNFYPSNALNEMMEEIEEFDSKFALHNPIQRLDPRERFLLLQEFRKELLSAQGLRDELTLLETRKKKVLEKLHRLDNNGVFISNEMSLDAAVAEYETQ